MVGVVFGAGSVAEGRGKRSSVFFGGRRLVEAGVDGGQVTLSPAMEWSGPECRGTRGSEALRRLCGSLAGGGRQVAGDTLEEFFPGI